LTDEHAEVWLSTSGSGAAEEAGDERAPPGLVKLGLVHHVNFQFEVAHWPMKRRLP
jgi:hypothetical protein